MLAKVNTLVDIHRVEGHSAILAAIAHLLFQVDNGIYYHLYLEA